MSVSLGLATEPRFGLRRSTDISSCRQACFVFQVSCVQDRSGCSAAAAAQLLVSMTQRGRARLRGFRGLIDRVFVTNFGA